jgi:hypothetical protein
VIQERVPAPEGYVARGQRIDPRAVNPWTVPAESLRAASETLEPCNGCGARGVQPCGTCGGAGRVACQSCAGTGKDGASSCASCRGAGGGPCATCNGRAVMTCTSCAGTRQQLAWYTFKESKRIAVTLEPMSAVVDAFPRLGKGFLTPEDLAPFRVLAQAEAQGRIGADALPFDDHEKLQEKGPRTDPRTDIVVRQQYARFIVLWREMTYEMCGMRGTLEQWGNSFSGKDSAEAMAPIRRRLAIWAGVGAALVFGTLIEIALLRIGLPYFRRANTIMALLAVFGCGAAIAFTGAVLRALRPRKMGRFRLYEIGLLAVFIATTTLTVLVKQGSRPTLEEATDAVHNGDFARAKVVMDALAAVGTPPDKIREIDDEMAFLEAQKATGDERLTKMEALAKGGGIRAAAAAADARQEKLRRVHNLITAGQLGDALEAIDKLFPNPQDGEIAELRASIYDTQYEQCTADPCRFIMASKAAKASSTPQRLVRVTDAKLKILKSLTPDFQPEPTLARLQRLRALDEAARAVTSSNTDDQELKEKARAAAKLAVEERDKVPVLGADKEVAQELLGKLEGTDGSTPHGVVEGLAIYLTMDKSGRCSGVYVVGVDKDARAKGMGGVHRPSLLLSKALGHPATVPQPPEAAAKEESGATATTKDGKVPVVARWRSGVLVELRIGDASP